MTTCIQRVFTSILRRIIDNQKGESDRRHWIVFDGDVDRT